MPDELRNETGSATALGVAVVVGLVSLLMIMASVSSWLVARSHAASIADIAALAAAADGSCDAAREVAQMNGSSVSECRWQGSDVIVVVASHVRGASTLLPAAIVEASASAGF